MSIKNQEDRKQLIAETKELTLEEQKKSFDEQFKLVVNKRKSILKQDEDNLLNVLCEMELSGQYPKLSETMRSNPYFNDTVYNGNSVPAFTVSNNIYNMIESIYGTLYSNSFVVSAEIDKYMKLRENAQFESSCEYFCYIFSLAKAILFNIKKTQYSEKSVMASLSIEKLDEYIHKYAEIEMADCFGISLPNNRNIESLKCEEDIEFNQGTKQITLRDKRLISDKIMNLPYDNSMNNKKNKKAIIEEEPTKEELSEGINLKEEDFINGNLLSKKIRGRK